MSGTIRIAHLSDTHLGYRGLTKTDPVTGRNQRTIDIETAFTRTIDHILTQDVDAVIHSGDAFHHTRPTWHSLRHFIRQMRRLEDAGIPTLVIAGNHDTPRMRTGGSAYSVLELALPKIRFVADYEAIEVTEAPFDRLDLHIHAIPHGALTNPDPVIPRLQRGKRNILVCHGMVPGILAPGHHAEQGEQQLDTALLDSQFDYIALGHYHVPSNPAPKAWYSGATERMGFGDWDVTPGYNVVEVHAPSEKVDVTHLPGEARPMTSLKAVYGNGRPARAIADDILEQLSKDDFVTAMVRVELRETERPIRRETDSILRREYQEFAWSLTLAQERTIFVTESADQPDGIDGVPDLQSLFATFVQERTGTHFDQVFATTFLERGSRALSDAILTQEAPAPEEEGAA
ncbi:MAG TPA: DNA repair exonuclease [Thermomicrobiales bacterium]|nr:DNA repair exonuclease [Thermomicrobiales bacterium]